MKPNKFVDITASDKRYRRSHIVETHQASKTSTNVTVGGDTVGGRY